VASLSQGRTAAAQCGLFTHKSVPVIFEPPCIIKGKPAPTSHASKRAVSPWDFCLTVSSALLFFRLEIYGLLSRSLS